MSAYTDEDMLRTFDEGYDEGYEARAVEEQEKLHAALALLSRSSGAGVVRVTEVRAALLGEASYSGSDDG